MAVQRVLIDGVSVNWACVSGGYTLTHTLGARDFVWRTSDMSLQPELMYLELLFACGDREYAAIGRPTTFVREIAPCVLHVYQAAHHGTTGSNLAMIDDLVDADAFASVVRVHFVLCRTGGRTVWFIGAAVRELAKWANLVYFDFYTPAGELVQSIAGDNCAPSTLKGLDGCKQPIERWCPAFHRGVFAKMQMVITAFVMGMAVRVGFDRLDPAVLEEVLRNIHACECVQ